MLKIPGVKTVVAWYSTVQDLCKYSAISVQRSNMRLFILATAILVASFASPPIEANGSWNDPNSDQFHIQTDEGPERYFRYQTESGQYRKEKRLEDGTVVGSYGWIDSDGILRLRDYIADNAGYRILRTKNVFVGRNRPISQAIKAAKKAPSSGGILTKTHAANNQYIPPSTTNGYINSPPTAAYIPPFSSTPRPYTPFVDISHNSLPSSTESPLLYNSLSSTILPPFPISSTPSPLGVSQVGLSNTILPPYSSTIAPPTIHPSTILPNYIPTSTPPTVYIAHKNAIPNLYAPSSTPIPNFSTPSTVYIPQKTFDLPLNNYYPSSTPSYNDLGSRITPSYIPPSSSSQDDFYIPPSAQSFPSSTPRYPVSTYVPSATNRPVYNQNSLDYAGFNDNYDANKFTNPYLYHNGPTYPIDRHGNAYHGYQGNPNIGNGYNTQYPKYDGVSVTNDGFRYYIPRAYHEEQNVEDKKSGSFGYIDPFGIRRVVYYNAGPNGFQHRKNNRYVGFNATPYDPRPLNK